MSLPTSRMMLKLTYLSIIGVLCLDRLVLGVMVGGANNLNLTTDHDARNIFEGVIQPACDSINTPVHMKLLKVTGATLQIVQGELYKFEFVMGATNCLKDVASDEACHILTEPPPSSPNYSCHVELWLRSWLNYPEKESSQIDCQPIQS